MILDSRFKENPSLDSNVGFSSIIKKKTTRKLDEKYHIELDDWHVSSSSFLAKQIHGRGLGLSGEMYREGLDRLLRVLRPIKGTRNLRIACEGDWRVTDERLKYTFEKVKRFASFKSVSFHFRWCNAIITEVGMGYFGQGLKCLKFLQRISFDSILSDLTDDGMAKFSKGLKTLVYLKDLEIIVRNEKITDKGMKALGRGLKGLTSLESIELNFSECTKITNTGFCYVSQSLKGMGLLKNLKFYFAFCDVEDSVIESLAKSLVNFKYLSRISLNFGPGEKISDNGIQILFGGLKDLSSLEYVYFIACKEITDKGVEYIGPILKGWGNLECLVLNFFGCKKITKEAQENFEQIVMELRLTEENKIIMW